MEEADRHIDRALGINSSDVRLFLIVASEACDCEVVRFRWPTVLARDNVIDVKRIWIERLRHATVLTATTRSPPDFVSQWLIHVVYREFEVFNVRRASD